MTIRQRKVSQPGLSQGMRETLLTTAIFTEQVLVLWESHGADLRQFTPAVIKTGERLGTIEGSVQRSSCQELTLVPRPERMATFPGCIKLSNCWLGMCP